MSPTPSSTPEELRPLEGFCNSATLLRGIDELRTVPEANAWLARNGWDPIESDEQAAWLRDEREALRGFLVNRSDLSARPALDGLIQEHWAGVRIDDAGHLALVPARSTLSPTGAAGEALLLHGLDASGLRLKACASADCRYVFYDSSRSRTRTWCDMNTCGARHKMRQYRTRPGSTAD